MIARSDARKEVGIHVGGWSSKEKLHLAATACSYDKSLGAVNLHPEQGETLVLSLFAGGFLVV